MHGGHQWLVTILLFTSATFAYASVDCSQSPSLKPPLPGVEPKGVPTIPYPDIDPQKVFRAFMNAVARGELIVFGESLAEDVLDPRRVEYIYTLETRLPTVRVHAVLNHPFPIPGAPSVRATAVTGVLDWAGSIVDSIVHCE